MPATTPEEMIADWKAKTDAATPGERYARGKVWGDYEVMALAHWPKLLAAVEAIRALHRPETRYVARGYEEYSFETRSDALEYGEEVTTFDVCVHCGRVETDDDEDRRYRDSIWPCATAKALDAALSGSEPDEGSGR